MFKIFDVVCKKCEKETIDFMFESNEPMPKCECGGELETNFGNFKLTYKLLYDPKKDSVGWANDGYATTKYYSEYKKAKEAGLDVMPGDETTAWKNQHKK